MGGWCVPPGDFLRALVRFRSFVAARPSYSHSPLDCFRGGRRRCRGTLVACPVGGGAPVPCTRHANTSPPMPASERVGWCVGTPPPESARTVRLVGPVVRAGSFRRRVPMDQRCRARRRSPPMPGRGGRGVPCQRRRNDPGHAVTMCGARLFPTITASAVSTQPCRHPCTHPVAHRASWRVTTCPRPGARQPQPQSRSSGPCRQPSIRHAARRSTRRSGQGQVHRGGGRHGTSRACPSDLGQNLHRPVDVGHVRDADATHRLPPNLMVGSRYRVSRRPA